MKQGNIDALTRAITDLEKELNRTTDNQVGYDLMQQIKDLKALKEEIIESRKVRELVSKYFTVELVEDVRQR